MSAPAARRRVRVGLARTRPDYEGLVAPFSPDRRYPELEELWGVDAGDGVAGSNHVYAAVRSALVGAGLDEARFGTAAWNPLGALVSPGARIVLKPNFIRHWNPCDEGTIDSVVTHGSVLRAVADYAWLAVGAEGSVVLAEAPQHDCDWDLVAKHAGVDALVEFYAERLGRTLEVIDLRRERVRYQDGVIVERIELPGDPAGYRLVDLGAHSAFAASGLDPKRFRGADYDVGPTTDHHTGGKHEYLLSESVLSCDLVVNLPKLKTHKKTGVTLALKNLVGINGDKNLLPHHCVGGADEGGDEFPGRSPADRLRSRATEIARKFLAKGIGTRVVRAVRRAEDAARGSDFIRSGNWHGNQTTWRMCLDLNRILYYSDAAGEHFDAAEPVRTVLTVIDGVVAGEGEGPLAPTDRPLGAVLASTDPLAVDLAAVELMGFDAAQLPKLDGAMRDSGLRVTSVRERGDVEVVEVCDEMRPGSEGASDWSSESLVLESLRADEPFIAHPGWRGQVEFERAPQGSRVRTAEAATCAE